MKKNLLLIIACLVISPLMAQEGGKLLPSEAIALMYYRVDMNPTASRDINTKPIQPRVITEGLEGDELFYLGETYFWNLLPNEANAAFEKLLDGNSLASRAAWQRYLIVKINGFQEYEEAEQMIKDYRKKFKPITEDISGNYFGIASLIYGYSQSGKHQKIVNLVKDELAYLDYSGPYSGFIGPVNHMSSFEAIGEKDTALELLKKSKDGLSKELEKRKANMPDANADIKYAEHSGPVNNMLTVMTEKNGYSQMNEKFEKLIGRIEKAIEEHSN